MADTYNLADLSRTPSPDPNRMEEFKLAAEKLHQILSEGKSEGKDIKHAFFGGFSLLLMGNTRIPADLDVVVDVKIAEVRKRLEKYKGISLPDSKLSDGVLRIFVEINHFKVHADILEKDRGLGRGASLGSTQNVACKTMQIPVVNFTQFINTKLKAWKDREESKDAKDIYFLVRKAGTHIHKNELNRDNVARFCHKRPEGLSQTEFETIKTALL